MFEFLNFVAKSYSKQVRKLPFKKLFFFTLGCGCAMGMFAVLQNSRSRRNQYPFMIKGMKLNQGHPFVVPAPVHAQGQQQPGGQGAMPPASGSAAGQPPQSHALNVQDDEDKEGQPPVSGSDATPNESSNLDTSGVEGTDDNGNDSSNDQADTSNKESEENAPGESSNASNEQEESNENEASQ